MGIAVGDALGAPVEFLDIDEIYEHFGKDGITDFYPWDGFETGSYTDDTQMSIATANGSIRTLNRGMSEESHTPSDVYNSYPGMVPSSE